MGSGHQQLEQVVVKASKTMGSCVPGSVRSRKKNGCLAGLGKVFRGLEFQIHGPGAVHPCSLEGKYHAAWVSQRKHAANINY